MKKILWIPQLSVISKNGDYLYENDSNFNFLNSFLSACKRHKNANNYEFYVVLPQYRDIINDTIVDKCSILYESSAFTKYIMLSRYNWNANTMMYILNAVNPDIIWENNPTLVMNWKTLIEEYKKSNISPKKISVFSYNHWIDSDVFPKVNRDIQYSFRQAEGAVFSDLHMCNSDFALQQIYNNIDSKINHKVDYDKFYVLPPMICESEFSKNIEKDNTGEINIIYNHRMSSDGYYALAFERFHYAIKNIKSKRNINVYITDSSRKTNDGDEMFGSSKCKNLNIKFKVVHTKSRKEYIELLEKCHIAVATFPSGCGGCWSMSLAEAICAKCAVIVPNHSGYCEMVPYDFPWKFDSHMKIFPWKFNSYEENEIESLENLSLMLSSLVDDVSMRKLNSQIAYGFYMQMYKSDILFNDFDRFLNERMEIL